jgi:hypothetical protein
VTAARPGGKGSFPVVGRRHDEMRWAILNRGRLAGQNPPEEARQRELGVITRRIRQKVGKNERGSAGFQPAHQGAGWKPALPRTP